MRFAKPGLECKLSWTKFSGFQFRLVDRLEIALAAVLTSAKSTFHESM